MEPGLLSDSSGQHDILPWHHMPVNISLYLFTRQPALRMVSDTWFLLSFSWENTFERVKRLCSASTGCVLGSNWLPHGTGACVDIYSSAILAWNGSQAAVQHNQGILITFNSDFQFKNQNHLVPSWVHNKTAKIWRTLKSCPVEPQYFDV